MQRLPRISRRGGRRGRRRTLGQRRHRRDSRRRNRPTEDHGDAPCRLLQAVGFGSHEIEDYSSDEGRRAMNPGADAPDPRICTAGHARGRQGHLGKIEKESWRFVGESRGRDRQVAASFNCHYQVWSACRDCDASDGGRSRRLRRARGRFQTGRSQPGSGHCHGGHDDHDGHDGSRDRSGRDVEGSAEHCDSTYGDRCLDPIAIHGQGYRSDGAESTDHSAIHQSECQSVKTL
jgi:hypothetical protein